MEYGVGIHGEPGIHREKIATADELAERMVNQLINELDYKDEELVVLVNGFGATPLQELYLLNNSVFRELHKRGIKVCKNFVGNYMTIIDMAGASLSIMKLDDELKELMKDECDTPAFKVSNNMNMNEYEEVVIEEKEIQVSYKVETCESLKGIKNEKISLENMIYILDKMSEVIIDNEVPFCELDSHAGDGDFGMSVAKGFRILKREWKDILKIENLNISEFLNACSLVIMEHCGGASGPIWGSAFRAASKSVINKDELTVKDFAEMMQEAVLGIQKTGERAFGRGAVVGDKTLIDALVPCADSWANNSNSFIE